MSKAIYLLIPPPDGTLNSIPDVQSMQFCHCGLVELCLNWYFQDMIKSAGMVQTVYKDQLIGETP